MRHGCAGFFQYLDFILRHVHRVGEDRIFSRDAELLQKFYDAVLAVIAPHALYHRLRFRHVRADAERMIVGKAAQLAK